MPEILHTLSERRERVLNPTIRERLTVSLDPVVYQAVRTLWAIAITKMRLKPGANRRNDAPTSDIGRRARSPDPSTTTIIRAGGCRKATIYRRRTN